MTAPPMARFVHVYPDGLADNPAPLPSGWAGRAAGTRLDGLPGRGRRDLPAGRRGAVLRELRRAGAGLRQAGGLLQLALPH